MPRATPRATPPPLEPTHATLREAAYAYLARNAASEAQVAALLKRKVGTWARAAERAGADAHETALAAERAASVIPAVVAELFAAHVLDDATFAASRARKLHAAGKSRRVILMHLASKGVSSDLAHEAVPRDGSVELEAAVRLAKKRHLGPFARDETEPSRVARQKQMGAMARAGFDPSTCERVLGMTLEEAEGLLGGPRGW